MRILSLRFVNYVIFLFVSTIYCNAQTITNTGPLNSMRYEHCSQVLSNGKVLVCGGEDGRILPTTYYKSAELYDPATGTWSYTGSMHVAREWFTSQILNNGNVLVIGGSNDPSVYKSCEVYDVASGTWTVVSSMLSGTMDMSSVKLKDGRILVAGGEGNIQTQIYDPEMDTWTYAGDMQLMHGASMAMVLLDNGFILATGGNDAPKKAELFNPYTHVWFSLGAQTARNHSEHTITKLNTGKYLIVGTGYANTDDQLSAELYDPIMQTFSTTGNLLDNVGAARTTLLDDGRVLLYCWGLGGKAIQIYNPASGIWSSTNTFFFSGDHATVNMLHNGKVLLSGGNYTVGEYASHYCYLVSQDVFSSCTPPSLTTSVQGKPVCNGFAGTVTLSVSESGVNFEAWIGNNLVGNAAGTNGALSLTIPEDALLPGANVVNIKAIKSGCTAYMLKDTAVVYIKLPSTPTPVITPSNPILLCSGQSATLSAPANMAAYQWTWIGETQQTISTGPPGFYSVRVKEGTGCYTRYSDPVRVTIASDNVNAGLDQSICSVTAPFVLTGFSPAGGTWSGPGVSAAGIFDPAISGNGTFTLTYSSCNRSDTKTIVVEDPLYVPDFTLTSGIPTVCFGNSIVEVVNPVQGIYYEFSHNNVILGGKWGRTYETYIQVPGYLEKETVITVMGIKSNACTSDTLKKQFTIQQWLDPTIGVGTKKAKLCKNDTGYVYITHSQVGVTYYLTTYQTPFGYTYLAGQEGNGDTLFLNAGPLTTNKTFGVYLWNNTGKCQYYMNQKISFEVTGPSALFTFEGYNVELGNNVRIINTSINPAGAYEWNFTSGANINSYLDRDPPFLNYTATGVKVVSLKCISPEGCMSTLTKKMHVINPVTNYCGDYSLSTGHNDLKATAIAFDEEDNFFQSFDHISSPLYHYSPRGDSIFMNEKIESRFGVMQPIVKYDSKGIIKWSAFLGHNNGWARSGSMVTDSLGNLYYAYFNSESVDSIRIYSTNGHYLTFAAVRENEVGSMIIVKFNQHGVYQWHNTYPERYTSNKISMILDSDLNLYVSSQLRTCKFTLSGQREWLKYVGYSDLVQDSRGNIWGLQYEKLIIDKFDSNGIVLFSTVEPVKLLTNTYITPLYLEIDEHDNLYVSGNFYGEFLFNNERLSDPYISGPGHNDLFVSKFNSIGEPKWIKQINSDFDTYLKGMDYKKGKIIFTGAAFNFIHYNKINNLGYIDTMSFLNYGHFICTMDTTASGLMDIVKVQDNTYPGFTTTPFDLIALSKKSDKIIYSNPDAASPILGRSFDVKSFTPLSYYTNTSVIMTLDYSCIFPETVPQSRFVVQEEKCVGTEVLFTDFSKANPKSWNWVFIGGGTTVVSTDENPSVVFPVADIYSVSLTTTNELGTGTTVTKNVQIDQYPVLSISPDETCMHTPFVLSATGALNYIWGQGAKGSTLNVADIISDTVIVVKGISQGGCATTFAHIIEVNPLPSVHFASTLFTVCANDTVNYPAVSPLGGTFYGHELYNNQFVSTGLSAGLYDLSYTYTDANGCVSTAVTTAEVQVCKPTVPTTPTGIINNSHSSSVILYPNPCHGKFNFKYPNPSQGEQCSIQIYNAAGQIVLEKKNIVTESEMTIDVDALSSGLYQFVLHSDKGELFVSHIVLQ